MVAQIALIPGRHDVGNMTHMAPTTSRPRKTVDDFMALGDEVRAELIDGGLYMTPSPSFRHQNLAAKLLLAIGPHVRDAKLGTVAIAPLDVHLPSGDIVEPDLMYVATENQGIIEKWIRGVPDLLIEIVSPSNPERDRIVKRALYAENGVPEYWIVEPETQTIEVLRLDGFAYAPAGYFGMGTELVTAAIPDLRVSIDEVFAA